MGKKDIDFTNVERMSPLAVLFVDRQGGQHRAKGLLGKEASSYLSA